METTTQTMEKPTTVLKVITRGPSGKQLRKPVAIHLPANMDKATASVYNYIIESLKGHMPSLIPFAVENKSIVQMARALKRFCSGSTATLYLYVIATDKYSRYVGKTPDELIRECQQPDGTINLKTIAVHTRLLEQYIDTLQAERLSPKTIADYVKGATALYAKNGIKITLPHRLTRRVTYMDRAPKPEELLHLIEIADIRGKVIISTLALGGFREGTLCQLKYRHIRHDLEKGIIPVHIHVEAEITKGQYAPFDTFLGKEAIDFIKAYLDIRRQGSPSGHIPPETIHDESPLIRDCRSKQPRPLNYTSIYRTVHNLYIKAGLIPRRGYRRYRIRPHSIRKFFRTQLAALGVDRDYIDYMMGHKVSTYHDIQMKGIEFLRNIYVASGLSIRPKTKLSQIEVLKEIVRSMGYDWKINPEQVLIRKALAEPHRTYATPHEREEDYIHELRHSLKDMLRKELLNIKDQEAKV